MKLSRSSWHVGLNDYVYGYGYSEGTKNLCPYFWGTLLSILICIPVALGRLANNIMSDGIKVFLSRYGLGVAWIIIGIYHFAANTGSGTFWFVAGICVLIFNYMLYETRILHNFVGFFTGRWKWERKQKEPKPKKERNPSMTIAMMKGWKNKHCPRVEWE